MAEVVRYVDPDASGAGDGTSWTDAYTSLSAWESGEQTDLVTAGDWHHVYCRSSAGSADTTAVTISGWTTGADNYILIEAADGDEAQKDGWKTDRYRLEVTDAIALQIEQGDVYIENLQIRLIYSSSTYQSAVRIQGVAALSGPIEIDGCRIRGQEGSGDSLLFYILDADNDYVTVQNSIIEYSHRDLVFVNAAATVHLWQNVIAHQDRGTNYGVNINNASATVDIRNCAIFDTNNDVQDAASSTIDYCATDDGDGINSVSPSGSDWDNEFNDPANGDFTLLNTGNCYHGGTTITGGPTYDIEGDEWDASTPSIGVDEYVSAGGTTSVPVFVHHYAMMRK